MKSKPLIRERQWFARIWWPLIVVRGLWTVFCAFVAEQLVFNQPNNMQAGFAAIGWEIILVISIPAYCLFIALLFNFPRRR